MKSKIEEKLSNCVSKLLDKDDLTTDEINFLVFWMNRLEAIERIELSKAEEEKMQKEKAKSNEAWKQSMYSMIENIGK